MPMHHHLIIAATQSADQRLEYLTRGFRQRPRHIDPTKLMFVALIMVAFVLALWLLAMLADYRRKRQAPSNSRLGLFVSLSRLHELSWRQQWLLWRVVWRHRLSDPARVFLEPDRLDAKSLGPRFHAQRARLDALRHRLFAGLPG